MLIDPALLSTAIVVIVMYTSKYFDADRFNTFC